MNKSSEVHLLKNVPVDSTYQNVIYFKSTSEGLNKFLSYTHTYDGSSLSYIYPQRNKIKCNGTITSDMYESNYVVFRNNSFENRYFYGFVKRVNYINDNTFEIDFELDLIHSYMQNLSLTRCFIERQHTVTDTRGTNLQPEPNLCSEMTKYNNHLYKIPVGAKIGVFDIKDGIPIDPNDYKTYQNFPDNEVSIIRVGKTKDLPFAVEHLYKDFIQKGATKQVAFFKYSPNRDLLPKIPKIESPKTLGNFTPKCEKTFSGVFLKACVDNCCGDVQKYSFEFGNKNELEFYLDAPYTGQEIVACVPEWYKGVQRSLNYSSVYDNFPEIPLPVDNYYDYINSNANKLSLTALGAITGAVLSTVSANPAIGLGASVGILGKQWATLSDAEASPSRYSSNAPVLKSSLVNMAFNQVGFNVYIEGPKTQDLQRIDEYLWRYGYAQNVTVTPRIDARPYWTYVKTKGSNVKGAMPDEARIKFNEIFDNGVTFWKTNAVVGDYSQNNKPSS